MRAIGFGLLALAASAWAHAAPVSTGIAVGGLVADPGVATSASLAEISPQVTQTDAFLAGGSPAADTFTGPSLWSVLQAQGGIVTRPGVKNDVLQTYSVVTGTDGYQAVVSSGEINPNFGDKPDLLAIEDTGGTLPGSGSPARLTTPGDVAGGRYVANVAAVAVGHGPSVAGTGGGPAAHFTVQGAVTNVLSFSLASLETLARDTETVSYLAAGQRVTDTYTGALLWDVLSAAGLRLDGAIKNDVLRQVVVATGSDGYSVDFAAGELSPSFGNEPILVAYEDAEGQLGTGGADGFARLVVPGDLAGGRYVSNLASLTVFDASVPEPASFPLLAGFLILRLAGYCTVTKRSGK